MRIATFFDQSPGTVGEYLEAALRNLGHMVDHFDMSGAEMCTGSYDLYLRIDYGDYTKWLPGQLRPRAFYIVDTHLRKSWKAIRQQAGDYDVLFCAEKAATHQLPRAYWVPLACDPKIHGSRALAPRYDIAFIGNDGGIPRKFYLQELRERYQNSYIGKAPHTEFAAIYSQAKIGFHYIECMTEFRDMVSMRVYEVLAAGKVLLTNALRENTYEALDLRDRRELVIYRNPKELFSLIEYYLKHEDEREQIGMAGQACVLGRHTYQHRARQMVDVVREHLGVSDADSCDWRSRYRAQRGAKA